MGFIGKQPTSAPLTASDITNDIINADKIADDSISDEHLDVTSITGHSEKTSLVDADKFLISDSAASGALKYVQNSNLGGGGSWNLVYSDDVSGMGSGSNAYSNSNLFSSTYNFYRVYILDWEPQNDSVDMNLQLTLGGSLRTSNYKFHLRRHESESAEKTGAYDIEIKSPDATNFFHGGVTHLDTDNETIATVVSDNDSNDFLTLTLVEAGSMVEMYCDGTNWFVTGHVASATAPAFGDASGL